MAYNFFVPEPIPMPPSPDLPALTVRWEGLVVAVDATTLNTFARQAIRNVPEIREVLIDPEDGRLGITVLSVQVKNVVCENGEMRLVFGPSQYRLDKLLSDMGRDPFADE